MTYICPGCASTSKKSWGCVCKKCGYETPESKFPTVENLITGKGSSKIQNWNDVDIPLFAQTLITKAIELNLIVRHANSTRV